MKQQTIGYTVGDDKREDLKVRFSYHAPKDDQVPRYIGLRGMGAQFATRILEETPPSREQSLALTKIEEAVFWANAAIARNE